MKTFIDFFSIKNFIPHGFCLSWNPVLLWLHVTSDLLITLSYYSIPLSLAYFIRKRKDLPYAWLVLMFGLFIVACGTTHLMSAVLIWIPLYWFDGYLKVFTAIISVATAIAMLRIIPLALQLPTVTQLQTEINERKKVEAELLVANTRFYTLFDNMRNGVAVYEAIDNGNDFIFRDFNRAAEVMDNITREELLNKPVTEVFPDVERFGLLAVMQRVWQTGEPENLPASLYQDERISVYRENYVYRLPSGEVVAVIEDVTERKKAELARQEASERLNKIANQLPNVVFQFRMRADGSFCIPYANEVLHDIYRLSPEDVREDATDIFATVHPDDLASHIEKIKASAEHLSPWSDEYRLKFADGTECWLVGNALPQPEADGSTLWHGVVSDVTERKQTEINLRASEERLNLSQEYGEIGSWEADLLSNKQIWSQAMFKLVNLPVSTNLTWEDFLAIIHPDDKQRVLDANQAHLAQKEKYDVEYRVMMTDGQMRWMRSAGRAEFSPDGTPIRFAGIAHDITERKKMEQALKASETHSREIKENLENILFSATEVSIISTDKNGLITIFNRGAELMLGYTADEMVGKQTPAIIHQKNEVEQRGQELSEELGRPIFGFNVFTEKANQLGWETREWTYVCKDKSLLTVSLVVTAIRNESDEITGYLGIADNITERKQLETELQRSNADLEQFAYAVSHDMRQPLRMVTSYLALIETALATQLDDDTRQFLTFAVDGAKRMDSMILSLLDYSRIGRQIGDTLAITSSRAAVDEALLFLKPALETSGGTVEVLGDWIDLIASRDELTRLLQNLIGNALKYHEENKPPVVEISASVTSNTFRVEVHDSGIGINPSQIDRLFKVFSRLQARSRFEGTGVGLALCRKIVEHHGGKIGVNSQGEGLGCTFWFELPRKPIEG